MWTTPLLLIFQYSSIFLFLSMLYILGKLDGYQKLVFLSYLGPINDQSGPRHRREHHVENLWHFRDVWVRVYRSGSVGVRLPNEPNKNPLQRTRNVENSNPSRANRQFRTERIYCRQSDINSRRSHCENTPANIFRLKLPLITATQWWNWPDLFGDEPQMLEFRSRRTHFRSTAAFVLLGEELHNSRRLYVQVSKISL